MLVRWPFDCVFPLIFLRKWSRQILIQEWNWIGSTERAFVIRVEPDFLWVTTHPLGQSLFPQHPSAAGLSVNEPRMNVRSVSLQRNNSRVPHQGEEVTNYSYSNYCNQVAFGGALVLFLVFPQVRKPEWRLSRHFVYRSIIFTPVVLLVTE